MAGRWLAMLAGLAATAVVASGCQRHGVLDPDAPAGKLDSGVIGGGGPPHGDAASPPSGDAGTPYSAGGGASGSGGTPDAGHADAPDAGGARDATDGGTIVTTAPTSMCALGSGLRPMPPSIAKAIPGCTAALPVSNAMLVGPAPTAQSYNRCGTLGPETAWRVTLSPDGGHLAALTSAGTVRLYRTDLWQEIAQIAEPIGSIDAIAFSPDGAWLAGLSSEMGRLTIWNVLDGVAAVKYYGSPTGTLGNPSSALAYSSDGRRIATSLGTVVDLQTGNMTSFTTEPSPGSIYSLRFVGCDQRLLVDGAWPSGMLGWVENLSLVDPVARTATAIAGSIYADISNVVTSPDSRWVAFVQIGDRTPGLHLYDAAAAKEVAFDSSTPPRFVAGFSSDGTRLFVVTDTAIEVRDVPSLKVLRRSTLTPGTVPTAATISSRDQVIISTDRESLWADPYMNTIARHQPYLIAGAQFSADGRFGVAAGDGGSLFHLWSEADPSIACSPPASPGDAAIAGFAASQDARTLAMIDAAGVVQLRPVDAIGAVYSPWSRVETGVAPYAQNISVAVANRGSRVAVVGHVPTASDSPYLSRLVVADTADGSLRIVRDVPRAPGPLAISPDGAFVAFQDGDYTTPSRAVVLSTATGATMLSLTNGLIDSFSPDSLQVAVSVNGAMQAFDIATGAAATTYSVAGMTYTRTALSPDWSLMGGVLAPVANGANQLAATVWHPQDGSIVKTIGSEGVFGAPPRFDATNAIVAALSVETHALGTNWSAWHIWSLSDGTALRAFPMSSAPTEPFAILPGGQRVLTRAGTAVAVWCR